MRVQWQWCAALLLLMVGMPLALAANWVEVSRNANGDIIYIDKDNILKSTLGEQTYEAWNKNVYKNLRRLKNPVYNVDDQKVAFCQSLRAYDCKNHRTALIKRVKYDADGHQLDAISSRPKTQEIVWHDVVPESMSDVMLKFVCP